MLREEEGEKFPVNSYATCVNMSKPKSESGVSLLLRHAAVHIMFLTDATRCVGESEEWSRGRCPRCSSHWINSSNRLPSSLRAFGIVILSDLLASPLVALLHPLSQVTEKLLEIENETMMKVADLEKLLFQKDKDLQAIRVTRHMLYVILSTGRLSAYLHLLSLSVYDLWS